MHHSDHHFDASSTGTTTCHMESYLPESNETSEFKFYGSIYKSTVNATCAPSATMHRHQVPGTRQTDVLIEAIASHSCSIMSKVTVSGTALFCSLLSTQKRICTSELPYMPGCGLELEGCHRKTIASACIASFLHGQSI
jgi:hypothetical protein